MPNRGGCAQRGERSWGNANTNVSLAVVTGCTIVAASRPAARHRRRTSTGNDAPDVTPTVVTPLSQAESGGPRPGTQRHLDQPNRNSILNCERPLVFVPAPSS